MADWDQLSLEDQAAILRIWQEDASSSPTASPRPTPPTDRRAASPLRWSYEAGGHDPLEAMSAEDRAAVLLALVEEAVDSGRPRPPSPPPEFQERPLSREELTKIQSPDAFRRASQKKHANRHPSPDFADQQECHKVPNSLLYKAFAQTTDPEIQSELVRFGYSDDNIRNQEGRHNVQQRRQEGRAGFFDHITTNLDQMDQQLADRLNTALRDVVAEGRMSSNTCGHLLKVMAQQSRPGRQWVADRDMRTYRDEHSKASIRDARSALEQLHRPELLAENQHRPSPGGAFVDVGVYESRGSANGSRLYEGPCGGRFHMSAAGNPVYHPRTPAASPPRRPPSPPRRAPSPVRHYPSPASRTIGFGGFGMPSGSFSSSMPSSGSFVGFHSSSGSANGRAVFQGPRGGQFHYSAAGNKVYHRR
ncbi:unnamed protein product [Durusdinium trenchii]|uniref:Uncharacterized protein n=1 Tax=Durusdinium trenchii TaxID=1381693 RepID=A0ABP0L5M6_9DINO